MLFRSDNYVKYRPGYPGSVISHLSEIGILNGNSVIADIGSGTGLSAKMFLENGNVVFGIEPNKEMREAGEHFLEAYPNFHSVDATAEKTTLADHSVDVVVAGQADGQEVLHAALAQLLVRDGSAGERQRQLVTDFRAVHQVERALVVVPGLVRGEHRVPRRAGRAERRVPADGVTAGRRGTSLLPTGVGTGTALPLLGTKAAGGIGCSTSET